MSKNQSYALLGLTGGILYGIADYFLYINSNLDRMNPDPAWADMSAERFLISMLFAILGSCFLYFGYLAVRRMLEQAGNRLEKALAAVGIVGVVTTVCAHFLLGCIMPLTYKAMAEAGCEAQYLVVSEFLNRYTRPISILAVIGIYAPHLASVCCLLRGRLGISRWRLAEVIGILLVAAGLSAAVFALLHLKGSLGAFESLFEGLLCLIPFWYWKRQEAASSAESGG